MNPDMFEIAYFLSGFVWTGTLNRSGVHFENNFVSVSKFTGFM